MKDTQKSREHTESRFLCPSLLFPLIFYFLSHFLYAASSYSCSCQLIRGAHADGMASAELAKLLDVFEEDLQFDQMLIGLQMNTSNKEEDGNSLSLISLQN